MIIPQKTHRPASKDFFSLALLLSLSLFAGCATTGAQQGSAPASASASPTSVTSPEGAAAATSTTATSSDAAAADVVPPRPDPVAELPANPPEPEVAVAPEAVDPLRPDVRLNPNEFETRSDLWARVRRGFGMPDLGNELTHEREQWYASRTDYFQRMTERGSRYLFHIVEEVERRNMPTELALLPFIESAFNPQALSSAKASGMWQFMPSTGKHFDLKQNVFRDDRRDVLASTRAALDYLQKLYGMFGDWHLALAAYNWGEGSVGKAIARNKAAGLPTDYMRLKMPNETRYYVPKLLAIKNLINRPEAFGLTLPELLNHPYFLSVAIERDMDVDPQMNKPVILAAGTARVLLPYDNANQFVRQLPLHRGPLASWTAWVAPSTLRPVDAARQVGMTEASLREVNHIPPRMLVKAGSTLMVPRSQNRLADVSEHVADNATMSLSPDGPLLKKVSLKAGRNDSVASVAKRYRVSPAQVGQWNGMASAGKFKAGQTIVVFVATKVSGAKATRHAAASGKRAGKVPHHAAAKRAVRVAKR
jgi:membrane-bound lytic murein transglycosylase D